MLDSVGRARLFRWAKILVSIVCLFLVLNALVSTTGQLRSLDLGADLGFAGLVSLFASVFGHLVLAVCWWFFLRSRGGVITLRQASYAVGCSQIAKYLPGNIAHFVGRLYLVRGVASKAEIMYSFLFEAALIVLAAVLVALPFHFDLMVELIRDHFLSVAMILTIIIGVFVAYFFLRVRKTAFLIKKVCKPAVFCLPLFVVSFFFQGLALFWIVSNGFDKPGSIGVLEFVSGYALAFVAGYLLPGASGGLGVRELAFVGLLSTSIGAAVAAASILFYRLITIVADVVVFLIARFYLAGNCSSEV